MLLELNDLRTENGRYFKHKVKASGALRRFLCFHMQMKFSEKAEKFLRSGFALAYKQRAFILRLIGYLFGL